MLKLLSALCLTGFALAATASELHFVTEDFPPFSYLESSQADGSAPHIAGPFVEIVRATCARLATDCPISLLPWRRALSLAEQGEVDAIFTVIDSPERREKFHISHMLVRSAYSVYALKSNPFVYRTPQDMAGRTVGVYGPSGTSYVLSQTLNTISNAKVDLHPNNRGLLRMLESERFGRDGVVVINQDVAWHLIDHEQLHSVQQVGTLAEVVYGIGFSKQRVEEERFLAFDNALAELIQDGTISTILRRYRLQSAW